jgi:hypothetical protein
MIGPASLIKMLILVLWQVCLHTGLQYNRRHGRQIQSLLLFSRSFALDRGWHDCSDHYAVPVKAYKKTAVSETPASECFDSQC